MRPRTVARVRDDVPWQVRRNTSTAGADKELSELAAGVRVAVTVVEPESVLALNLLGDPVELPVAERPETLLIGNPERFRPAAGPHAGRPCWHLRLRRMAKDVLTPGEVADALCRTATDVLNRVYWRWSVDLSDLWAELGESDQLDVEAAAEMVLDEVRSHLSRLRTNRLPTFLPKLKDLRAARRREVEARRGGRQVSTSGHADAADAIRSLLREDPQAQAEVLDALRAKVNESGYDTASIPLELFQNADDAAAESGGDAGTVGPP